MYIRRQKSWKTIRFSLKSGPSEQFHTPEMSQIKAEISLRTNVKLICHKNVGWQGINGFPDFYNIRFDHNGHENFKNGVFLVKFGQIWPNLKP